MFYYTNYKSPIGKIVLASDGENIVGLWNDGQKYFGAKIRDNMIEKSDLPVFMRTKKWLDKYFAGKNPDVAELALAPMGSDFQMHVWDILCEIPYGSVTTYGEISKKVAKRMGRKNMSAQAVGGAIGHNPISIIIPCHRVVGTSGSLTGYAGGINKKIKLLEIEGVDLSKFSIPTCGTAI